MKMTIPKLCFSHMGAAPGLASIRTLTPHRCGRSILDAVPIPTAQEIVGAWNSGYRRRAVKVINAHRAGGCFMMAVATKPALKENSPPEFIGHWFSKQDYPPETIVCPLCWLPETTGEYKHECHCWDDRDEKRFPK